MKRLSLFSISCSSVLCAGVALLMVLPSLNADPVKKRTEVTFSQPTEIPGMVLEAGTYVMKIPDPYTHSDMVGFYNPTESHLYKLVRTIPAYRMNRTDKTVITFEERAAGAPEAIHTWFFPSEHYGREFVYSKAEAVTPVTQTIAQSTPPPAPPAVTERPAPVAQTPAPAPQQPVEVAQATPPPAPAATPAPSTEPKELPKTASPYPGFLAAGGFLLLAGLALRLKA